MNRAPFAATSSASSSDRLRIGFVTNFHMECVGGAEEAYDRLATLWQRGGHQVTMFCTPPRARREFHRRPWQPEYEVVSMPYPYSTRFGLRRYVNILAQHHARRPLDLLLAGDTYWAGYVAHRFAQRTGVPYVINSQGVGLIEGCRFANRWLTRRRIARAITAADCFIAPSKYIRERALALTTLPARERVIPNGWPDEWSTTPIGPAPCRGRYVFGMGRLVPLKGFHTLVEAMTLLHARHPEVGLVIAGNGAAWPSLIDLARSCGWQVHASAEPPDDIAGRAWFPGFVHGDAKRALIAGAELAVSPSIRQEPMSLALFEVLSCGVPVVGSNVGGTPDIVRTGVNGELFAADQPADLAGKLDRLLADTSYRRRLADGALPSVRPFQWSTVAERFLNVFREVLPPRVRRAA